ncbi:3'-5' exoribonuclease [Mobilisporobacter senegalensis]|uniref:3'-5' exoribonuclease n=1 Tax=Mobilisporobacter senegalensis TaxID=1329262 RepID=A0A3N1XZT9_9FIRM|nr:HD domain-containing protein [Mobilisporobacter senegalensis]ROR31788.1 3'-5' exoribonuclease [Mobilisporobacter senegalensis]
MRFINELHDGDMVTGTYLCKKKETLKTKAGKSYYSLILQDKTGILDAKVWELSNGIDHFESMDYIHIEGQITSFQNALQLNVKRIRKSQEGEYNESDFFPVSNKNVEEMYGELLKYINNIKEPHLRKLVSSFFVEDKDFIIRFKKHSAAKSVHHGFIGGLLEHTLGVVKFANYIADNYHIINRDLLISSALFHDIGKMDELSTFPENDYTDDGQLLGHIFIGAEQVGLRIREIPGFPVKLASEIRHCILAHHGELEYGSPKKPALVEAMALNIADNADAKLQSMIELFQSADDRTDWLGYNRLFESNIRRSSSYNS